MSERPDSSNASGAETQDTDKALAYAQVTSFLDFHDRLDYKLTPEQRRILRDRCYYLLDNGLQIVETTCEKTSVEDVSCLAAEISRTIDELKLTGDDPQSVRREVAKSLNQPGGISSLAFGDPDLKNMLSVVVHGHRDTYPSCFDENDFAFHVDHHTLLGLTAPARLAMGMLDQNRKHKKFVGLRYGGDDGERALQVYSILAEDIKGWFLPLKAKLEEKGFLSDYHQHYYERGFEYGIQSADPDGDPDPSPELFIGLESYVDSPPRLAVEVTLEALTQKRRALLGESYSEIKKCDSRYIGRVPLYRGDALDLEGLMSAYEKIKADFLAIKSRADL